MITLWLVTLTALTLAALLLGIAIHLDRGTRCPPLSHFRDPRFRSPMSMP